MRQDSLWIRSASAWPSSAAVGKYGFCLAGGYAVQAHGFVDRPSEDVDLFTTAAERHSPTAVAAVIQAYRDDGLDLAVSISNTGFARFSSR